MAKSSSVGLVWAQQLLTAATRALFLLEVEPECASPVGSGLGRNQSVNVGIGMHTCTRSFRMYPEPASSDYRGPEYENSSIHSTP